MNVFTIVLTVVIPLIVGAFFGIAIWRWHAGKNMKTYLPTKHTSVYKFDLRTRKILQADMVELQRPPFRGLDPKEWNQINIILDKFDDKAQRLFRIAFDKLEKGSDFEKIVFDHPSLNFKKHMTRFTFTFYKGEESLRYFMKLDWNAKPIEKKKKVLEKRHLTKEQIAEYPAKAKGFVAFNVIFGNEQSLLEVISKLYITKRELMFFHSAGYLIFMFPGKTTKDAKNKINKFIKLFIKAGYQSGGNQMFEGSAYIAAPKAATVKLVNSYVQSIDFLISVSIETRKNFVGKEILDSRRTEFDSFVEASKSFRLSIKTKDIESKSMFVRNWKTKRKTVEYVYPRIQGINNKLISRILRNKNNIEALIDSHADKMILENNIENPCLIDVTQEWIIKNENEIKDRNIIYVVRIDPYKDLMPLQDTLTRLIQREFVFAFKIKDYTDAVTTLIQNVKPNFIVVSKRVWNTEGLLDSDVFFKLMTMKKMADQLRIKMIYQEPSKIVDETTADKIGLQFYFDISE